MPWRILENIITKDKLVQFDALAHYNKYTDVFNYEAVPEKERQEVAQSVAAQVLDSLENPGHTEVSTCEASSACSACGG